MRQAFFAVVWFLLSLPALGEDAPAEDGPSLPQPIPVAEVAERAEETASLLRRSRALAEPDVSIEAVKDLLAGAISELERRRVETQTLLKHRPALAKLNSLERDWRRQASELEAWRTTLTRRVARLGREVEKLRSLDQVWSASLTSANERGAPDEVIAAITRSEEEIKDVREVVSRRRGEVLGLQNRVAQQELLASEVLESIDESRATIRDRLFEPDSAPIWSALSDSDAKPTANIATALKTNWVAIRGFVGERPRHVGLVALFFVVAWLAARNLKRSVAARRAAGGKIERSAEALEHPLALALVAALLLTYWIFPLAPSAFFDGVGLLLLLPLVVLLPRLTHTEFRPVLYAVAAFYVVDRLRAAFQGAALESRVIFAIECVAASCLCILLLRPARLAKVPDANSVPRWLGTAVRVALVVFSVSFLANVLGYFSLSKVLGEGMLATVYTAIAVYAGVQILWTAVDVGTRTARAQKLQFLRARRGVAVGWILRGISIAGALLWAYLSLGSFAVRDPVVAAARTALTTSVTWGEAAVSLGDVAAFAITIAASIVFSRVVRFLLMEDVFPRIRTGRGIPHAVSATAQYVILFLGFLLAVAAAGIDLSRFALLAGAFGVGIGFGLQNVVNNFVSGIILLFERPIQVGDTIDLGNQLGVIRRIGIRSSTLRTYQGSEIIVPNADLISQQVTNWTLSDKTRRVDIPIGVKYGTEPDRVLELLRGVAEREEKSLSYPSPVALFRGHGDSSLDFELRVWIADYDDWYVVQSRINTEINRALTEADIEIPFPQRDLHLRSIDVDAARELSGRGKP